MSYLEIYFLISRYLWVPKFPCIVEMLLNVTVIRECTLHDFNFLKTVQIFFMFQDIIILMKIPCVIKKNVYLTVFRLNGLYFHAGSCWFVGLLKAFIFLLLFCLDDLPIIKTGE